MNTQEYNKTVDLLADRVFRFIYSQVKDRQLAEDIVQDAFEKMWLHCAEINQATAKSWLFTTAYRGMIDHIRRADKQRRLSDETVQHYLSEAQYSDLQEILHKAIQQLPDVQQSVILLRDYEGYSYQEIEAITGLKESQVKVYIYRARLFLKQFIGKPENVI